LAASAARLRIGGAVAHRPLQRHLARPQHQCGVAGRAARRGGQRYRLAAQHRLVLGTSEQPLAAGQHAIMMGADHQLRAGGPQRERVVDIALPIGDNGHASRPGRFQFAGFVGRGEPTVALFRRERTFATIVFLTAGAAQEFRVHQTEQRAVEGVDRDRHLQIEAVLITIVAQCGGVLDHQDVAAFDKPGGTRRRGRDHFRRCHAVIVQKPSKPDLACAVAAQRADTHAGLANLNDTVQQERSAFLQPAVAKLSQVKLHLSYSDSLSGR
jgi:hypothetical protein